MARKSSRISGQFAPRLVEMLESPAWRVLSLGARKVLDRIEIELAHHGGKDNGRLPVTYDDFVKYGLHRHAIRPAINELTFLGFLEITRKGRAGNAEYREPNLFRLTYRPCEGARGDGSHEWKTIKSDEEAARLAKAARALKTKNQCRKPHPSSGEKRHRRSKIHSTVTITTTHGPESATTFDISGGVSPAEPPREARQPHGAVASEAAANTKNATVEEDEAAIHQRIAHRLGRVGWFALNELPLQELERVTRLEALGRLDEQELERLRLIGAASQSKSWAPIH